MAGDVDNPRIWEGADVYVADVGTSAPTGVEDSWPAGWDALGLLSEDGATMGREQEVKDHYAWGGILVRTSKKKHKRTIKVTALEDNATLFDLVNPGSDVATVGDVTTRTVNVPSGQDIRAFGLQIADGDIITRIIIPRGEVVEVADVTVGPEEMAAKELTINIFADDDSKWYDEITNDPQAIATS